MKKEHVKDHLDRLVSLANSVDFIENDPISIPHQFTKKEDIEIAGFFASIFAWGQRKTIINKTRDLLQRMDNEPYDFILNHGNDDLKSLQGFIHRTFSETDLLYFVDRLHRFYKEEGGLEMAFSKSISKKDDSIEPALIQFYSDFFDVDYFPKRSQKHIASPQKKSTCKRLCMYLRWMVRDDTVDFGIWKQILPSQLMIPLDVHVERVARSLGLLHRKQKDWQSVVELTHHLRAFNPEDPVIYDFALFGATVNSTI